MCCWETQFGFGGWVVVKKYLHSLKCQTDLFGGALVYNHNKSILLSALFVVYFQSIANYTHQLIKFFCEWITEKNPLLILFVVSNPILLFSIASFLYFTSYLALSNFD
jgi:hypothetical protein